MHSGYPGDRKRRGSVLSAQRSSASEQSTPSPRPMESDGAEFDYLFNSPIETYEPASPLRSSENSRSRSLSDSDLNADISDDSSQHASSRRSGKRRKRSYLEESGDPLFFRPVLSESSIPAGTAKEHKSRMCEQDHLLDHSKPTFFTPTRRSKQRRKSRSSTRSLAEGVFTHQVQPLDGNSKAIPRETYDIRTSRRDPYIQLALGESCRTQDASILPRLDRSTSGRMEPESYARERFERGACDSHVSPAQGASTSSGSLAMTQIQSAIAASQAGRPVARDMCIQSISPELSFLIFILPDIMSAKPLIYPQEGQDATSSLGCYGVLENVVVKQIQSQMWLVAGTVRNSNVSCTEPKHKDDLMSSSNAEAHSAYGNMSDDCSNSSGQQFLAKNQRWSPEDDRILCEWVKTGRPWSWIIRQFPLRTPGSVRTRYSMLRRKSTQP
ncbi:hypothetical protein B0J12DRAFT_641879 [Macrophomina phaseolina]|uniref:Myb-like domain-containing protein n=1 Tax=Macrophomina phaseolina TaxID=35725 RepID=A0ABQ8GV20_9PEZI|nr:hypothetical protein B0J12DRAFT_641879 [Macrophomina phaseolina]